MAGMEWPSGDQDNPPFGCVSGVEHSDGPGKDFCFAVAADSRRSQASARPQVPCRQVQQALLKLSDVEGRDGPQDSADGTRNDPGSGPGLGDSVERSGPAPAALVDTAGSGSPHWRKASGHARPSLQDNSWGPLGSMGREPILPPTAKDSAGLRGEQLASLLAGEMDKSQQAPAVGKDSETVCGCQRVPPRGGTCILRPATGLPVQRTGEQQRQDASADPADIESTPAPDRHLESATLNREGSRPIHRRKGPPAELQQAPRTVTANLGISSTLPLEQTGRRHEDGSIASKNSLDQYYSEFNGKAATKKPRARTFTQYGSHLPPLTLCQAALTGPEHGATAPHGKSISRLRTTRLCIQSGIRAKFYSWTPYSLLVPLRVIVID
jgi:hypothetical protein